MSIVKAKHAYTSAAPEGADASKVRASNWNEDHTISGVIMEFDKTITTNMTLSATKASLSVGPVTIADGVSVTVPVGGRWVIL